MDDNYLMQTKSITLKQVIS